MKEWMELVDSIVALLLEEISQYISVVTREKYENNIESVRSISNCCVYRQNLHRVRLEFMD